LQSDKQKTFVFWKKGGRGKFSQIGGGRKFVSLEERRSAPADARKTFPVEFLKGRPRWLNRHGEKKGARSVCRSNRIVEKCGTGKENSSLSVIQKKS